MKILSPLDLVSEVEPLIEAGAEEFYCGVLEENWYNPYPVISINRRPAGKGHFKNFEELKRAVALSHRMQIPVYFTLNEHYYSKSQIPLVKEYIQRAVEAGVDALIIADYGLFALLSALPRIKIHISTGGTVFNWRAARFYQELGASRITLPRHLSLKEMKEIVTHLAGLETTAFVFNSRCINVDGFCTFQHGLSGKQTPLLYRNACMLPYTISSIPLTRDNTEEHVTNPQLIARQRLWEQVHLDDYPCAACSLYELNEMKITSVKIVGRGNASERKLKDVTFFRTLLNYLQYQQSTRNRFRNFARELYQNTYHRPCRPFMCYYPEVMKKA